MNFGGGLAIMAVLSKELVDRRRGRLTGARGDEAARAGAGGRCARRRARPAGRSGDPDRARRRDRRVPAPRRGEGVTLGRLLLILFSANVLTFGNGRVMVPIL